MNDLLGDTIKATTVLRAFLGTRQGVVDVGIHVKTFQQLALKWKRIAGKMDIKSRKQFFDTNMAWFYDIHTVLVGYYISDGHKEFVQLFRSSHDRIFGSMDIKLPGVKFNKLPTMVFNEFVKGLTYFASEPVMESPVYHRSPSCGSSTLDINDKFKRIHGYSENAAVANREHVKRCYIERIIYDCIFRELLHRQDLAHLQELQRMTRLYQDMYRDSNLLQLQVSVSNYVGNPPIYPTQLKLSSGEFDPMNAAEYYCETYLKEDNGNTVRCGKYENTELYHKFQTFAKETPWLKGAHKRQPRNAFKAFTA